LTPNNNNTSIPTIEIRQNNVITTIINFERLKKNNLIVSIVLYPSDSGNILFGTIKDPNVIAIEIPSIYQTPNEYIGNSGATIKVVVSNINHSIEKILAGTSQLFK
tara:strand:+ start:120 stop:437 length:318 start_codon:yes stop_codon:yes gene_type:complete